MLITSAHQLDELVEELSREAVIAVDTEFHGERRFWPDLFLIQLAGSNGPVAVDPLEIGDLSPLGTLFESSSPVKVMHSSRNDIDVLSHHLGMSFSSVFDTQLAAAFLGCDRQISLSKLIRAECGVNTGKGHTLSDWSLRPLSDEQIEYALDDVRFLLSIYTAQVRKLEECGHIGWYRQEAEWLTASRECDEQLRKLFRRIRSKSKTGKERLHLLWSLLLWRERTAMEMNKPRGYILKDHILGAITSLAPRNRKNLSRLRGVSDGFIAKWGDQIIKVVCDSMKSPGNDFPKIPSHHARPGVAARRDILRIFLKQESCRLGISPELLLTRDTINVLAKDPPSSEEELCSIEGLSGWRREALGEGLVSLLKGELALKLNSSRNSGLTFVRFDD